MNLYKFLQDFNGTVRRLMKDANWDFQTALRYFNEFVDRDILCLEDFELN